MSQASSNAGSRWFMVGALTLMVLGLAWSGWQWSQAKRPGAASPPVAPAAAPAAPAPEESAPPAPSEAPEHRGEILEG